MTKRRFGLCMCAGTAWVWWPLLRSEGAVCSRFRASIRCKSRSHGKWLLLWLQCEWDCRWSEMRGQWGATPCASAHAVQLTKPNFSCQRMIFWRLCEAVENDAWSIIRLTSSPSKFSYCAPVLHSLCMYAHTPSSPCFWQRTVKYNGRLDG